MASTKVLAPELLSWAKVVAPEDLQNASYKIAKQIVDGPTFGNMMTKTMLAQEWSMSIEQIIESEAQAQAICMQTGDFKRAYAYIDFLDSETIRMLVEQSRNSILNEIKSVKKNIIKRSIDCSQVNSRLFYLHCHKFKIIKMARNKNCGFF